MLDLVLTLVNALFVWAALESWLKKNAAVQPDEIVQLVGISAAAAKWTAPPVLESMSMRLSMIMIPSWLAAISLPGSVIAATIPFFAAAAIADAMRRLIPPFTSTYLAIGVLLFGAMEEFIRRSGAANVYREIGMPEVAAMMESGFGIPPLTQSAIGCVLGVVLLVGPSLLMRGRGFIGGGDVRLVAAIGATAGPIQTPLIIALAAMLAIAKLTMFSRIDVPFQERMSSFGVDLSIVAILVIFLSNWF